jgi:UDP-N-acetylmuramate--alanine ligase
LRDQEETLLSDTEADRLLRQETGELGSFSIGLAGAHNVQNALAVLATGLELGLSLLDIRRHLGEFIGTARRLELLGEYHGAKIYDDYAHHPAEIKATLSAVRQLYPKNELVLVFHPHTFTRTKAFLAQFAESFALADELILLDIYGSAREQQGGVSSQELLEKIEALRPRGFAPKELRHIPDKSACAAYLRTHLRRGQILVLMGAGDVFRIADELLK